MATELNSFLYESSTKDTYATLFYAQLQPETSALTSINAGHNYPLVVRQDGSSKWLEKGGLVLGMYPDDMLMQIWEYEQETTQLCCGDTVLFYTDGVTETLNINDDMYGEERLVEKANRMPHATANEICTAIYTSVLDFQGEAQQFDDLTLIVLKRK
ncbi:serine/threonine-protein phosphatase [Candidatus Poribacteria bacterium]|nr:serine/threonine-protein phosphatase [Candidatus Poribacteria bacterium]